MNSQLRPAKVIAALMAAAIASAIGSVALDNNGGWDDPGQAAANLLWILFLVSTLAVIVFTVRFLARRGRTA